MTLVHFHLADAEGRGLDGSVSLVPTRRVTVRDAIRLPVAQTVKLDKGEATAEVMPSTTQWVWRVSELVAGGIVRYVEVPDKESAEYSGLVDVDPATLDQSSETVAAWETVTRAAQAVLDQIGSIDDKVARAESSAQAAKASEGVAVGWPPNASTGSTAPWDSTTTHREDRQCDIPSERSHMADDIITSVVAGLLIAAISAIAAGLWHQLKNLRSQVADEETRRSEHEQLMADMRRGCEHEKLVDEALRTLLLCKLEQQQDTMVHDHHGVADNDFKLRAQRVYDAYHGLGGNGHGTQVNNDIQNAPIAPRLGGKPS